MPCVYDVDGDRLRVQHDDPTICSPAWEVNAADAARRLGSLQALDNELGLLKLSAHEAAVVVDSRAELLWKLEHIPDRRVLLQQRELVDGRALRLSLRLGHDEIRAIPVAAFVRQLEAAPAHRNVARRILVRFDFHDSADAAARRQGVQQTVPADLEPARYLRFVDLHTPSYT